MRTYDIIIDNCFITPCLISPKMEPLDLRVRKRSRDEEETILLDREEFMSSPENNECHGSDSTHFVVPDTSYDVTRSSDAIAVSLMDAHIWNAFSAKGTEMIINRNGRRMFPHVTTSISGLSTSGLYNIWLEIVLANNKRYKFVDNKWIAVSRADPARTTRYLHHDSPNTGEFWMNDKISFARLKLTNNKDSVRGNILLQSMHKYMARVCVEAIGSEFQGNPLLTFTFDETTFVAVTAYQNQSITKMKIHNNPFAKAFRDKNFTRNCQKQSRDASLAIAGVKPPGNSQKRRFSECSQDPFQTYAATFEAASSARWQCGTIPGYSFQSHGLPPLYRSYDVTPPQRPWPMGTYYCPKPFLLQHDLAQFFSSPIQKESQDGETCGSQDA